MVRIQQALLPGILIAVITVIAFTTLISQAGVAQAYSESSAPQPANLQDTSSAGSPAVQSACSLPQRFPSNILQWCNLIENYAQKNNLEPQLIASVMLQESGGNPAAYSASGAVGLMQVMPRDGLAADFMCSGRPCFASRPTMADLYDPEYNISYGARMLAGLIQKRGSVREALKAYGPGDAGYSYADKVLGIYQSFQ